MNLFNNLKKCAITGFVYTYKNNKIYHYYENIENIRHEQYILDKIKKYGREYIKVNNFNEMIHSNIVCFTTSDFYYKLKPLYDIMISDAWNGFTNWVSDGWNSFWSFSWI